MRNRPKAIGGPRSQHPSTQNTSQETSTWARTKAWALRAFQKVTTTARAAWMKLSKAVTTGRVERVRNAVRKAVRATVATVVRVLPSIRMFLRVCLVSAAASAWLAAFLVVPVPVLFGTFAAMGALVLFSVVVGWLDKQKTPATTFVLDAIDVSAKAVGIMLEVGMAGVLAASVAAMTPVQIVLGTLTFGAWVACDTKLRPPLAARKRTPRAQAAAEVDEPFRTEEGAQPYREGRDPFARASSSESTTSTCR